MTPKEKAEVLMDKMNVVHYLKLKGKNKDYKGLPVSMHKSQVKQCALLAIDEVIEEICAILDKYFIIHRLAYWKEVKEEVEKFN